MGLIVKLNEEGKDLGLKSIETSNENSLIAEPQSFSPEYTKVEDYIRSLKCSCSCLCHGKC